jgi:hypothetical protein
LAMRCFLGKYCTLFEHTTLVRVYYKGMHEMEKGRVTRRRRSRRFVGLVRWVRAFLLWSTHRIVPDIGIFFRHIRLFFGSVLVCIGLLSFASGRYCDGAVITQVSCTRPATYYYYPWWAIMMVASGTVLLALWVLHREKQARRE